ncbi:MAG: hypothetical protein NT080_03120 [Spirochaetes bacterium]|nr:hypothetical protein [Spirochaetota bacterium]
MKKTTLIVSYDAPFARAIASELALVDRVPAMAVASAADEPVEPDLMSWRPASYASTRSVILEAAGVDGGFSEAILVAPYPAEGFVHGAADELPGTIASRMDERAAGFMVMARELYAKLSSTGGRMLLVHPPAEAFAECGTLSEAAAAGAVDAFSSGLARLSARTDDAASCETLDIVDACPQRELSAQFAAKSLDRPLERKTPRTVRFTGKSGLFGLF